MSLKRKIIIIVLSVLAAGAAFFFFGAKKFLPDNFGKSSESLYGNPAEKIPETNPFQTKTNPFKGGYKNPFSK